MRYNIATVCLLFSPNDTKEHQLGNALTMLTVHATVCAYPVNAVQCNAMRYIALLVICGCGGEGDAGNDGVSGCELSRATLYYDSQHIQVTQYMCPKEEVMKAIG